MPFVPIQTDDYVRLFLQHNPESDATEVTTRIKAALAAFTAGVRCSCGAPIWVIGSAEAGHACFTCLTGQAAPDDDYEIAEACIERDA